MNLEALKAILKNREEILEESALNNGVNSSVIVGIAKFATVNGYEKLSSPQKYHFDNCIRHLIENVQCYGYTHECEEKHQECHNTLDDDLVEHYSSIDGKYCMRCEAQASADAYTKESFFRD